MKVCQICNKLNPDNADICMGCRSNISQLNSTDQRNVKDSIEQIEKQGILSKESAEALKIGQSQRIVKIPDLKVTFEDPIFSCFLYDASGSMRICREAVIASQPILLNALRATTKCRHDALFVSQYLFNNNVHALHGFIPLAKTQELDEVAIFDMNVYDPNGGTALYKTVYSVLQDIVVMMESNAVEGNSQKPQFTIGLITDGEDTEKGVNPDIIRNVINDLSNREIIRSAVIIGLVNNQLSKETLEHIRKELGFHQAIPCSQETNKDIRRAFLIASESTVRAYKGD